MQCVPGVVFNINIFNNQSERMLTKRAEQDLESSCYGWPGCMQGDIKALGQHLLSTVTNLVQYFNKHFSYTMVCVCVRDSGC